jgi:hypothetical protein
MVVHICNLNTWEVEAEDPGLLRKEKKNNKNQTKGKRGRGRENSAISFGRALCSMSIFF